MILADTSAWGEYNRGTGSSVDLRIAQLIANDGPLMVTEPVMMEALAMLAGARDEARDHDLRRLLQRMGWLSFDATTDFDAATRLYRRSTASPMSSASIWTQDQLASRRFRRPQLRRLRSCVVTLPALAGADLKASGSG